MVGVAQLVMLVFRGVSLDESTDFHSQLLVATTATAP